MSQSAKKAEEQKKSQEQGPGSWKGQGLPAKAVPDPGLVGGDLQKDGRGFVLLATWAPAHHPHQVPCTIGRADQGLAS